MGPLIVAALIAPAPADLQDALMAKIEARVVMPKGADPLDRYARYYARRDDGSVVAVYVSPYGTERPGRQWVSPDRLPLVFDGGCSVVEVSYDPARDLVTSIRCHGVA